MTPRIGSLFSGYGGLDAGVQAVLGGTVAWHSEIDLGACKILAHRYPDVPNLGDITAVDWSAAEPVDVLTGGFPCQDVSCAGLRKGLRPDTRSGLWTQMAYAIDRLRPSLVVAENVRGLLSAEAHSDLEPCPWCVGDGGGVPLRALGAVLGDLADLGYDASWQGLRAADVGAPHGRFRVFVVAWPTADADSQHGWARSAGPKAGYGRRPSDPHGAVASHAEGTRLEECWAVGSPAERAAAVGGRSAPDAHRDAVRQQPVTVTGRSGPSVAGLPGPDVAADADVERLAGAEQSASRRPPSTDHTGRRDHPAADTDYGTDDWERARPEPRGGGETAPHADGAGLGRLKELHAAPQAGHGARYGHDADRLAMAARGVDWGPYGDAVRRWERRLGRPAPSPTERGKNGQPRLAPAFVEWMMGLPAGWVTDVPRLGRNEQLKALGNGVVPQQAAHALRLLLPDARAAA